MDKNFENLKNEIIKKINGLEFEMNFYKQKRDNTTNQKIIKLYTKYIDDAFSIKTEMELILRKFYSWDEIKELENN